MKNPVQITVDRTLVHKESADAVLLTHARRAAPGHWTFGVSLPVGHATARHSDSRIATMLSAEMMRQSALAFAHLDADVPLGWPFLLHEIDFSWRADPGPLAGPTEFLGQLDVRTYGARYRRGTLSDLQIEAVLTCGDVLVGVGYGDLSCLPRLTYKAIRRNAPPVEMVNTGSLETVLSAVRVSGTVLEAAVVWNWNDPFIFDHFSDHIPGMLLAQGSLEAHREMTGAEATQVHMQFRSFGEFDQPVRLRAERGDDGWTLVRVHQGEREIATAHCLSGPYDPARQRAVPLFQRSLS